MRLIWTPHAWEEYLSWQKADKRTLKRINLLIRGALREPFSGLGKPEPLKGDLSGFWSRRITAEHRLVYEVTDDSLSIVQCRFHYSK